MSVVTNAILTWECDDVSEETLRQANAFFTGGAGFVSVSDPKLPQGWYGGTKSLECEIAIGAFNHLDLGGLVHHLRENVPWEEGSSPQLIIREQYEDDFRIIDLTQSSCRGPSQGRT